jgi:outer membrane lipoprotein-sorting protein
LWIRRIDIAPDPEADQGRPRAARAWIDRESLLLVQMQMTFPGGDRKTIRRDEVTVNVPVTDETFQTRP